MLGLLRDPAAYRMVDRVHQHRSKRVGDLPKDDPREFISGHRQRLQNLGKTVGSAEDKKVLDARRENVEEDRDYDFER